jgi:hypothetical protein
VKQNDHANLISFESTLKYAEFPSLELNSETKIHDLREDHREIEIVLEWLVKQKKVKQVIELIVPDRLHCPHNESVIAKWTEKLEVEILNWKCLDLSISVLGEGSKKRIRDLHLYASGKRAVISHWLSCEGISKLSNVRSPTNGSPLSSNRFHILASKSFHLYSQGVRRFYLFFHSGFL